jgi:hypothetical protein
MLTSRDRILQKVVMIGQVLPHVEVKPDPESGLRKRV